MDCLYFILGFLGSLTVLTLVIYFIDYAIKQYGKIF